MLLIGRSALKATGARFLIARNSLGPLRSGRAGFAGRVENARAQKSGDELQFVGGQALHEAKGLGLARTIGTRNQSGYQATPHGESPEGDEPYLFA
jgi:hypothetical protein